MPFDASQTFVSLQGIVAKDYRPLVEQVWRLLEDEPSTQHKAKALGLARGTVTSIEEQLASGEPVVIAPKTVKALQAYLRSRGATMPESEGAAETALRLISVVIQRAESDPDGFREWASELLRPGITESWRNQAAEGEESTDGD